jgi:hypothetical protein
MKKQGAAFFNQGRRSNSCLSCRNLTIGGTEADAERCAKSFETGKIVVAQAEGETCERCRMVSKEIGEDPDHPNFALAVLKS